MIYKILIIIIIQIKFDEFSVCVEFAVETFTNIFCSKTFVSELALACRYIFVCVGTYVLVYYFYVRTYIIICNCLPAMFRVRIYQVSKIPIHNIYYVRMNKRTRAIFIYPTTVFVQNWIEFHEIDLHFYPDRERKGLNLR